MEYCLAIDIGASSGRHIVGWIEDGRLVTDEVYRFPNGVTELDGHLVWDIDSLAAAVKYGIKAALKKYRVRSVAIDTWGVDYVLMRGSIPVMPCYSYRDGRTADAIEAVHAAMPFAELYSATGIQFQPFNTVYQLADDMRRGRLAGVTDFLMIPEYLAYTLTGVRKKEYTNATTTGMINAATGRWDENIISRLGLPDALFGRLDMPGTVVGPLSSAVAAEVGGNMTVMLCATHDTASAVDAIPISLDTPYISSGTWSLLGVKTSSAHTDGRSRAANYSNEGGVGYIRYQKNIMGMWVVNGLRRELCPDKPFDAIVAEARGSTFTETVDVNGAAFLAPQSMTAAFDGALKNKPKNPADYFNCAFRSLAMGYNAALCELESNTGKTYSELYIVGGGAKNAYLNELTEEMTHKKVVAMPIEATAIGNLMIQLKACGNTDARI